MEKTISVNLKIWRQRGPKEKGQFVKYYLENVSTGSSFLEMLDMLNQKLVEKGEEPVVFDSDCREGICGMCSLYINGHPHGPVQGITTCQLHMRKFNDGDTITIEPWRSAAFPVIRDLTVDRNAFDKIQQAGGYVSFNCGGAPDANAMPISKEVADVAMDSATCIGCGACVAACKNGSKHMGEYTQPQSQCNPPIIALFSSNPYHLCHILLGKQDITKPHRDNQRQKKFKKYTQNSASALIYSFF